MNTTARWIAGLLICLSTNALAQNAAPALPPGLDIPSDPPKSTPSLPPGLGSDSASPALPPGLGSPTESTLKQEDKGDEGLSSLPIDVHGFWDTRAGFRTTNDAAQPRDFTLAESRLQLESDHAWDRATLEFTGDFLADGVMEEADFDLRRLRVSTSLMDNLDLSVGRQVLTWGTGDLLFINDLFPKDWQSFLIGRDVEYLKAPSDAVKLSAYTDLVNIDLVYTPQFDHDRFITGERISFWSPQAGQRLGRDNETNSDTPNDYFDDDEIALRLHRTFGSAEVALYGYDGFWKSPGGQNPTTGEATFPRLSVYGASVRDTVGKGIVHAEIGYYDSRDDSTGDDPLINNSEFRFLTGYEREIAKELTGSLQYYLVRLQDYDAYRDTLPSTVDPKDEYRHVVTLRLTKLLMDQDLTLSSFLFVSPSDHDGYWRPQATYSVNDHWEVSTGGNLFFGKYDHTFFGQFEDNSNLYISAQYSF